MKTNPNKHFKILKIEDMLQSKHKNAKDKKHEKSNYKDMQNFNMSSDDIVDCFNDSKCMIYEENNIKTEQSTNILQNRYKIVKTIGSGDFCDVYLAIKKHDTKSNMCDDEINVLYNSSDTKSSNVQNVTANNDNVHATYNCMKTCNTTNKAHANKKHINKHVCVKKNRKPFKSDFDRKNKLKEIKIMKMIQSKNILKMNYVFEENNFLYIETEFCEFGTLKNLIHGIYFEKKIKFDKVLICKLMKEIANGLRVMHKNKIVHSDLKPENIFIQRKVYKKKICDEEENDVKNDMNVHNDVHNSNVSNGVANEMHLNESYNFNGSSDTLANPHFNTLNNNDTSKITHDTPTNADSSTKIIEKLCLDGCFDYFIFKIGDFNISRFTKDEIDEDGDKKYMAPEILLNKNTTASDIFSLGLIYLELLTGIVLPTKGTEWIKLRNNNLKSIKNIKECDKIILMKMIDKNCNKRIKAKEVYKYFTKEMKKCV
ncbi:mitosis inhibitor protein kinase swe1 [Binucleata daphniae]